MSVSVSVSVSVCDPLSVCVFGARNITCCSAACSGANPEYAYAEVLSLSSSKYGTDGERKLGMSKWSPRRDLNKNTFLA